MLEKYREYIRKHREVEYKVSLEALPEALAVHKWVGAQSVADDFYGIPNDMDAILKHTETGNQYLGQVGNSLFKWTGGCIWNGFLYGFSRSSNSLLKMSLDIEKIQYVELKEAYLGEHHYGGICTKEGIVYQPPRDSDHILVWNLNTEKTERIYLASKSENRKFRYCGSILHPSGFAYFLPEAREKVIKLDIKTKLWTFIGEPIEAMVFDAKIGVDGCIYGYSAYCPGILKIDPMSDAVKMIHREIWPGAYGTKLGVNGHLYSIPGDGDKVWDYDIETDNLKSIYTFPGKFKAKYAGGSTMRNGMILAVPAREHTLLQLKANATELEIPEDIYLEYFWDCY
ncbi:MAG: hypothetical protein HFJ10_09735 [Lachnospiraceae bacterium]|nr:hypothetical protein [Lachnospiraceae bacterium]